MTAKRKIYVEKQKKLTLEKSVRFCLKGINHRLFRSFLTLVVVIMAVAFFMALLSENAILNSTARGIEQEMGTLQEANLFLSYVYAIPGNQEQVKRLAEAYGEPALLEEYAKITGMKMETLKALAETSYKELLYLNFFDNMSIGKRRILVKKNRKREIFSYLAVEGNWQDFLKGLEPLRSLKLPTTDDEFLHFIKTYPEYQQQLGHFSALWKSKVDSLTGETGKITANRKIELWLVNAKEQELQNWRSLLDKYGFKLDMAKVKRIQGQLKKWHLKSQIMNTLKMRESKKRWKEAFLDNPPLEDKLAKLNHPKVIKILDNKYSSEELAAVSKAVSYQQLVAHLSQYLNAKMEKATGSILSGRQLFLLLISFVVCMVGIANAMLMSITERFREIATMKCLGATDSFVLTQFLIEAALQGFIGGLVGMLLGVILTIFKNVLVLGGFVFTFLPVVDLVYCGIISVAAGVLLSMMASIYPSWAASKMAPMEAMRIE